MFDDSSVDQCANKKKKILSRPPGFTQTDPIPLAPLARAPPSLLRSVRARGQSSSLSLVYITQALNYTAHTPLTPREGRT